MFGRKFSAYLAGSFADQFEPQECGFLYRRSLRGAPVQVTASEREAFIETFVRRAKILTWLLFAAILVLVFAEVGYASAHGIEVQDWWTYLGTLLMVAGFVIAWVRIWNAPTAHLQGRPPVGPETSRAEVRRKMRAKMSWGQIAAFGALLVFTMVVNLPDEEATANIGDWLLVLMAGIALLGWAYVAIQKLRLRE